MPVVKSDKVVWLDARNESTTGTDIYGYDIASSTYFTVTTIPGNQSLFQFNGRYVLYTTKTDVDMGTHRKCEGLYLYDTMTSSTTTITTTEILPIITISSGSTPIIAWSEKITNSNGDFYAIKYMTVGNQNSSYISNVNDLTYSQFLSNNECINNEYIGWIKTDVTNMVYNPYVFKFSDSTNHALDEPSCDCIEFTLDNEYAMWVRNRINEGQEFNICGTLLP
jgi:archaellin